MNGSAVKAKYAAEDCDDDLSLYHKRVVSNGLAGAMLQQSGPTQTCMDAEPVSTGLQDAGSECAGPALLKELESQIPRLLRVMASGRRLPANAVTTIRALVRALPEMNAARALPGT